MCHTPYARRTVCVYVHCIIYVSSLQVCSLGPLQLFESLANNGLLGEGSRIGMITSEGGGIALRTEVLYPA